MLNWSIEIKGVERIEAPLEKILAMDVVCNEMQNEGLVLGKEDDGLYL